jgi:hypothetical protein
MRSKHPITLQWLVLVVVLCLNQVHSSPLPRLGKSKTKTLASTTATTPANKKSSRLGSALQMGGVLAVGAVAGAALPKLVSAGDDKLKSHYVQKNADELQEKARREAEMQQKYNQQQMTLQNSYAMQNQYGAPNIYPNQQLPLLANQQQMLLQNQFAQEEKEKKEKQKMKEDYDNLLKEIDAVNAKLSAVEPKKETTATAPVTSATDKSILEEVASIKAQIAEVKTSNNLNAASSHTASAPKQQEVYGFDDYALDFNRGSAKSFPAAKTSTEGTTNLAPQTNPSGPMNRDTASVQQQFDQIKSSQDYSYFGNENAPYNIGQSATGNQVGMGNINSVQAPQLQNTYQQPAQDKQSQNTYQYPALDHQVQNNYQYPPQGQQLQNTYQYPPLGQQLQNTYQQPAQDKQSQNTYQYPALDQQSQNTYQYPPLGQQLQNTYQQPAQDKQSQKTLQYPPLDQQSQKNYQYSAQDKQSQKALQYPAQDQQLQNTYQYTPLDQQSQNNYQYSAQDKQSQKTLQYPPLDQQSQNNYQYSAQDKQSQKALQYPSQDQQLQNTYQYSAQDKQSQKTYQFSAQDKQSQNNYQYPPQGQQLQNTYQQPAQDKQLQNTYQYPAQDQQSQNTYTYPAQDQKLQNTNQYSAQGQQSQNTYQRPAQEQQSQTWNYNSNSGAVNTNSNGGTFTNYNAWNTRRQQQNQLDYSGNGNNAPNLNTLPSESYNQYDDGSWGQQSNQYRPTQQPRNDFAHDGSNANNFNVANSGYYNGQAQDQSRSVQQTPQTNYYRDGGKGQYLNGADSAYYNNVDRNGGQQQYNPRATPVSSQAYASQNTYQNSNGYQYERNEYPARTNFNHQNGAGNVNYNPEFESRASNGPLNQMDPTHGPYQAPPPYQQYQSTQSTFPQSAAPRRDNSFDSHQYNEGNGMSYPTQQDGRSQGYLPQAPPQNNWQQHNRNPYNLPQYLTQYSTAQQGQTVVPAKEMDYKLPSAFQEAELQPPAQQLPSSRDSYSPNPLSNHNQVTNAATLTSFGKAPQVDNNIAFEKPLDSFPFNSMDAMNTKYPLESAEGALDYNYGDY